MHLVDAGIGERADPDRSRRVAPSRAPRFWPEGALLGIANMLKAGITCFCDVGYFPAPGCGAAAVAGDAGLRSACRWRSSRAPGRRTPANTSRRALQLRDEYKGHPSISTGFAPLRAEPISDATFARIAILADELDAGILRLAA